MIAVPLVAVASVKASPGVTTTALALAAAWPAQRRLLIEADPSGGDLGPWLCLPPGPGLASLAAAARHDHRRAMIWHHARELPSGTCVVLAPPGAGQAAACLATLAGTGVLSPFTDGPGVAIADCGRLDPGSPALSLAAQAAVTLLLIRPYVSELSHLAPQVAGLAGAGLRLSLLLAHEPGRLPSEPPYGAREITETLHLPVHTSIPADPRTAAHLLDAQGALPAGKSPLTEAAANLIAALDTDSTWPQPPPSASDSGPPGSAPGEVTAGERAV